VAPLASRIWPGPQTYPSIGARRVCLGQALTTLLVIGRLPLRRRAILPRLPSYPRSRYLRTLKRRLLSRHDLRRILFGWVITIKVCGGTRQHLLRPRAWLRVFARRPKSLGSNTGTPNQHTLPCSMVLWIGLLRNWFILADMSFLGCQARNASLRDVASLNNE